MLLVYGKTIWYLSWHQKSYFRLYGRHTVDPTYEEVKTQTTGHTEAVLIEFDPSVVSYEQLVEIYWNQTDPTDALGQFQDCGDSYRPVIFVKDATQRKDRWKITDSFGKQWALWQTDRDPDRRCSTFYPAEEYHQDFTKRSCSLWVRRSWWTLAFIEKYWIARSEFTYWVDSDLSLNFLSFSLKITYEILVYLLLDNHCFRFIRERIDQLKQQVNKHVSQ